MFPEEDCCNSNCYFLRNQLIHINASGLAEPCPFCQVATDSIREKTLEEILDSDFFKDIHMEFDNSSDQNTPCVLFDNKGKIQSISEEIHSLELESINNN
jgi:hypothetical protein